MSHIMSQSSRFRSLFVSALFALPVVAEPLLPGTLWAAEKKIEFPAASQHATIAGLAEYLDGERGADTTEWPTLVQLRVGNAQPPLFLVSWADGEVLPCRLKQ